MACLTMYIHCRVAELCCAIVERDVVVKAKAKKKLTRVRGFLATQARYRGLGASIYPY